MSQKFPGGFITKSPVAPTTTAASGIWTLDQQEQYQQAGTWPSPPPPNYIEDVFSTWLYTGNNTTQTITNGIDVSTKGGLVWIKDRTTAANNYLFDTERGATSRIFSNLTNAASTASSTAYFQSFNNNGFTVGYANSDSASNYASWTFRKQLKFFDVQTWVGNGTDGRQIPHNLGSVPGCIIIKAISGSYGTRSWNVWHKAINPTSTNNMLVLNTTDAQVTTPLLYNTLPTATNITLSSDGEVNGPNIGTPTTYIAYIFAHNAGGFGATETDNVITCGSYTGNGSTTGPVITLGYEPQWIMIKNASSTGNWVMQDIMRGMPLTPSTMTLFANLSNAETAAGVSRVQPTATGFAIANTASGDLNASGETYIYIAIRRGPMKVPTDGTSVFYPQAISQADTIDSTGVPFPPDLVNTFSRNGTDRGVSYNQFQFADRLRGLGTPNNTLTASAPSLISSNTSAENTSSSYIQLKADSQNIVRSTGWNSADYGNWIDYFWRRAPSFFDEVCYTGTGSNLTLNHNLGVAPEIIIIKKRVAIGSSTSWYCGWNMNASTYMEAILNTTGAGTSYSYPNWFISAPTSTTFALAGGGNVNSSGATAVAYLFATCAGVSKVGSYTGTGALQTVNCGFTSGARFVLIKRTDSTGDWYTYDSARGITSGNDPYLLLNSTAAEVTGTNYVDTDTTGFQVTAAAPAGLNASGGTYIFLAIA